MSDSDEEFSFFNEDDLPQRTSSAPPILEVQPGSLFAAGNSYAHFFSAEKDIRTDDDYLQFYQTFGETRKLPPPLTSFDMLHEDFEYSPSPDSPRIPKHFLPHNFDGNSPRESRWSRPLPKRVTSISSLEDYSLGAEELLPDLSSDSESVCSSVEDISTLIKNFGIGPSGPEKYGTNRYLWDNEPLAPEPLRSHANGNGASLPPGLTVNSVEQALGDAEVMHDVPSHRRKEPQRGQNSSSAPVACRYFAQGYCSRGDRCNFAHIAESEPESAWPPQTPASPPPPTSQPPVSQPKPIKGGKRNAAAAAAAAAHAPPAAQHHAPSANGTNTSPAGHKRRNSHSPSSSSGNFSSNAGATPAPFVMGTSTLSGRYTSIEQVIGQIYPMCKDQHGCRFLQKKLDEENSQVVDTIFNEVYPHFGELMTDPFGNYLCQKLMEHCNDKQRLQLIESVANDLVRISQNMHGTRAVQKMIECLRNNQEIRMVTRGLRLSVVQLIKDLNGNHVVQRCLNHLSSQDNQFIYDAVAGHCVEVATHRHGCCVLQRCIDHASESQKLQLVNEITNNGLTLVKDPYGNYVVQYVLDLNYVRMTANLILQFSGHLPELSTQKFSSNVVEKCLNVADPHTRAWMIKELTETDQLKALIQDPFGNYVIQTAMTVAEPVQHAKLVEGIKPFLYALRNTPYGKRIQNKIMKDAQQADKRGSMGEASSDRGGRMPMHHKYHHK